MRFRVDPSLRRLDGDRVLLGGSPLRVLRLTDAGARWFGGVVSGADQPVSDDGDGATAPGLLRRLLDSGVVHPDVSVGAPSVGSPPCSVVVPVRDRPEDLEALLVSLRDAGGVDEILVVDDGSRDAGAHRRVAERAGARCLRREAPGGPAVARDAGIRAAAHDTVVVVDSDVRVADGWLAPLLAHLEDPRVAAVGARVLSGPGPGAVAAYELTGSPLDLGPDPARVAPGTRVAYVPSATLLIRRSAYLEVGGFDGDLRFGEDVDLEWRLIAAGWSVRHEPSSVVTHRPRPHLRAFLRQRHEYGTSAAALDERHPGSVPPWRASRWSLLIWVLVAIGLPGVAALVAAGTAVVFVRRPTGLPPATAAGLVVRGHLGAGRSLARALVRTWWPVALAASLVSRRARRAVVAAVVVAVADRWRAAGTPAPLGTVPFSTVPLGLLDDVAYGTGVWTGCWRRRRWGPLLPVLDP